RGQWGLAWHGGLERRQGKGVAGGMTEPDAQGPDGQGGPQPGEEVLGSEVINGNPPPMKASAVRIQDRNVRSLARVNRGSGSSPSGKIRRAIRPRGSSVESSSLTPRG